MSTTKLSAAKVDCQLNFDATWQRDIMNEVENIACGGELKLVSGKPNCDTRLTRAMFCFLTTACLLLALPASGQERKSTAESLTSQFDELIQPFMQQHCLDCHAGEEPEAKLDLSIFRQPSEVAEGHKHWQIIRERLELREMPPQDSQQPSDEENAKVVAWIDAFLRHEAYEQAGDPGIVLARRLSNAEYDYVIRDLTGQDIKPTRLFPVDPANEAGFDNSGESLTMSPALLMKYLDAARFVAEHLVLKPQGLAFAPHPVVTETDRDKYCVKRIVQFYRRQPCDLAAYFLAARELELGGDNDERLTALASQSRISAKYLGLVWQTLRSDVNNVGPLALLREIWRDLLQAELPADEVAARAAEMEQLVAGVRRKLAGKIQNLYVPGSHKGSQPFVLWKNRQYQKYRRTLHEEAWRVAAAQEPDGVLKYPEDEAERDSQRQALEQFCDVFPDRFYVAERGRDYLDELRTEQEKGRLLSAGFHSMMGYFRDDEPLYDLILDESQQQELDRLWQELNFVTHAPLRQYSGFLWFERTDSRFLRDQEFDFARAEDKAAQTEETIQKLADLYLAKAVDSEASSEAQDAIEFYFRDMNQQIRWVETTARSAQESHLLAVLEFAQKAYRRPLKASEVADLRAFYRSLRDDRRLTHAEAVEDLLVAVLMSPNFCFRLDLAAPHEALSTLSDLELASRLSFFLWSSMPDTELLEHAAEGRLHEPEVLLQQTRRMLRDPKVRGMATEFAGNWLDFRRFEEHNSVDRERFPEFTDELREAMFQEPIRFFIDVARHDRSVLEFLSANHTFVNPVLARHYGVELPADSGWQRIEVADRGGLIPMGVFLTQNSPGLRTSPVKRGYWVVRQLLGERIPPPPPNVPELPQDESQLGEKSLREVLAAHREHASCRGCHHRFDGLGLAFEGFGPVGERRNLDLSGKPIDDSAELPDGASADGVGGLRAYLQTQRQGEFVGNLSQKLLSYALSRTLQLSDEPLLESVEQELRKKDYRFSVLIEEIVTSPQFLRKRGSREPIKDEVGQRPQLDRADSLVTKER